MHNKRGFTPIELTIILTVMVVVFGIFTIIIRPVSVMENARDARRFSDIAELLNVIHLQSTQQDVVEIQSLNSLTAGEVYMIGKATQNCNVDCSASVTSSKHCADLSDLVDSKYLIKVPVATSINNKWGEDYSGYTISKTQSGTVIVQACEAEGVDSIVLSR